MIRIAHKNSCNHLSSVGLNNHVAVKIVVMRLFRFLKILSVVIRYGLDEFLVGSPRGSIFASIWHGLFFWRKFTQPRAVRLRLALESLGPIFVKFGQILSTRPDLVPHDIATELSKLQDRVPPFAEADVIATLTEAYGANYSAVFEEFDLTPIASASVAQVHFAKLAVPSADAPASLQKLAHKLVAVKILRPGIGAVITKDCALLDTLAEIIENNLRDGKRLRPREVVAEFARSLGDELDLIREASNASTLRRNFADGTLLYVPEVYFDYCHKSVMVMERLDAIPVNDLVQLKALNIDIERLATDGVKIFFTQVFRDGFFHADMHPGNIFVGRNGIYSGVDFGIMGTLSDGDKAYLARNFAAFFRRDYKDVAIAHIEAGWVPAHTRVEEFESAIRSVCEPIFDKPLNEIYFGNVLLRLFDVSRRFQMEIQPQLVLLQKTLLQVEGLGRQLYPQLDLRPVAQPILIAWMDEQVGLRGIARAMQREAPMWAHTLPQLPRMLQRALTRDHVAGLEVAIKQLERTQRVQTAILVIIAVILLAVAIAYGFVLFQML